MTGVVYPGTTGDDSFVGGSGDDVLHGKDGDDTLKGAAGRDFIYGEAGSDVLLGGSGNDYLVDEVAGERNLLDGGGGHDVVLGSATDTLIGGEGIDYFELDLSALTASNDLNLAAAFGAAGVTFADGTRVSGFERGRVRFGSGDDRLDLGDAGDFTVYGGAGDDTVLGGAGDDHVTDGAGDDRLQGGGGVDWLSYFDAARGVTVSLAASGPQNTRGAGVDTLSGFENLAGSSSADRLIGDGGANVINGGGGGDTIKGGGGNDRLSAGGWSSLVDGGAGDDILGVSDYMAGHFYETLFGGKGQDFLWPGHVSTAVYASVKDSTFARPDEIVFRESLTIDLQAVDADENVVGDQAFTLVSAFSRHAGELLVTVRPNVNGGDETWILIDVDGDGRADSRIRMTGDHRDFDDFVL